MIVIFLFFCSGATALVYEVAWSKYLSLVLGSSVQAQTVVLAAYMGGLALGNRWFGRHADRWSKPLVAYGYLEVAIGLYAFFFDNLHAGADRLFIALGTGRLEHNAFLLVVKAALGALLLLGPTLLMGGTLPVLAAWLQRRFPDAGRWSARFYSINSLGAVLGAGLAGFVLIRQLGMVSTLQLTALVNVLVGFTAVGLGRFQKPQPTATLAPSTAAPATVAPSTVTPASPGVLRAACALVALTGGVSMGLEVLASRSLVLLVGASLQAFAIVLIAFILGIGLGSAVVASPRFRRLPWAGTAILLLLLAAAWVGTLVTASEHWVTLYRYLKSGLARSEIGFWYHQILTGGLSLVVLGFPAALIGAVVPVSMRALSEGTSELGRHVGRLLTWNTLGAVVGSLLTGFVFMPWLGLRSAFYVHVTLLCAAAAWLAWTQQRRLVSAGAIALAALLLLGGQRTDEGWQYAMSCGIFRFRENRVDPNLLEQRRREVKLLFYEDAADATVSVEQELTVRSGQTNVVLRVNGKPDASTSVDMATQILCAHVPLAVRPDAKEVFVLGLGSGVTAAAALRYPLEQLVVAENCAPVLRAADCFAHWNGGVTTNSRVRLVLDDGRTVLKLSPRKYDVIINEPSNPWMVGVGSVFSREYYELCASRVKDDGLVVQWFHFYETSDPIVLLVLRTFTSVFPYTEIWDVNVGDIILVGSRRPWATGPEAFRKAFTYPAVKEQLDSLGYTSPELLWARQWASQRTAFAIGGNGPIQSDRFPILEYDAPRAFFIGASATALAGYDERTWPTPLAPPGKHDVLSRFGTNDLRSAFKGSPTGNPELAALLSFRLGDSKTLPTSVRAMPMVFDPNPWSATERTPLPQDAEAEHHLLFAAEGIIRNHGPDWRDGVDQIVAILKRQANRSADSPAIASLAYYAGVAAAACLQHGDVTAAGLALQAGLALDPSSAGLAYLARLVVRESAANPGAAPSQ